MLSVNAVRDQLQELGFMAPGTVLEPIEWIESMAPAGALDDLAAYQLIDPSYTPVRDRAARGWIPVLAAGDDILVDVSPEMFDRMLAGCGYFDQPEAFGKPLLTQFHRLALDYYQGYQVREQEIEFVEGQLIISGSATQGAGHSLREYLFKTTAGRNQAAQFEVEESPSQQFR